MKTISSLLNDIEITPELQNTFDSIKKELNAPFVPNFFKVWGNAPTALKGIFPVMQYILTSGELDRKLKEMIMIAISSSQECKYCETAHQAFCSMAGGTPEEIESLKSSNTLLENSSPKEKAAIDFAVQISKDPKSSNEEDFKTLQQLGYTISQIMEIIAMSGMGVFYNHLADATKINLDRELLATTPNRNKI
ncbi:carboxymuconolactone decarboxylase family protein [Aquimarina sp. RZ0]|uniref:carboxymuconolactone decarboxylase family protein n=1 Tax=Aquimarina sp. RZ0 TaxID=2607730 RepID=UPI0011F27486|nr:peroxidase-related enzyme [Aquimarina sp. RZ0]KAA1242609.1 peroxidase-related enzyme [Aquimarina sp. RZ0]